MSKKRLFMIVAAVTMLAAVAKADPGIPDTIRVTDVQVNQGDHFAYPVFIANDENLSGGTLGFDWGTNDLFLDSISYIGSVLESIPPGQRPGTIDNSNHQVLTGFFTIFDPPVPPSTGTWVTLWFTANPAATDQVVTFDSTKVGPSGDFLLIALTGNESIAPQYVSGTITIGNPISNTPPTMNPIANQTVAEGDALIVPVSAADAESIPALSALGLQAFMGFTDNGDGTGAFSANPGFTDAGVYPVSVVATDGEFSDTASFQVTVTNTNRGPGWAAVASQTVDEGQHLEFKVSATDPDGDALTLTQILLPANATFADSGNGAGGVFFDPDFTQAGIHTVQLVASDGSLADTMSVQVTVNDVSRAPVWAITSAQTVDEGQHLEFRVSATDPDSDALTITALSLPTNATVADSGNGAAAVFFDPDFSQAGAAPVLLEVSDGDLTDTLAVGITVNNVNRPPVIAAIGDTTISVAQTLALSLSASDPDGGSPTLTLTGLPASNASFSDNGDGTASLTFTPDVSQANTVFPMALNASDGDTTVSLSFDVTVGPPPAADSAFVSADTLFFAGEEGGPAPATQCVDVSSTNAPAPYTVTGVAGSPVFTTPTADSGVTNSSLCFNVDQSGLTQGMYFNTVTLTVADVDNNPLTVVMKLTVTPAPVVDSGFVTPDTLCFTADAGSEILLSGCANLTSTNVGASYNGVVNPGSDPLFVTLIDTAGVTPDSVCVSVLPGALAPGLYYNTVEYEITGVVNNTVNLVVCLTVNEVAAPDSAYVVPDTFFFSMDEGSSPGFTSCAQVSSTNAPASYTAGVSGSPLFTDLLSAGGMTNDSLCFQIVNAAGLTPGVYYNDVTINVDSVMNNPVGFVVSLTVNEVIQPDSSTLAISDSLFLFESTYGVPFIGGDSLLIMNVGPGPDFGWEIMKMTSTFIDTMGFPHVDTSGLIPPFVDVSPLTGTTPGVSFISVDNDSLEPGMYMCDFYVIADSGVFNSPQMFTVTLKVNPPVQPQLQILEVSDSVFTYFANEGEPNIICDTLSIFNTGDGPEFGWTIQEGMCYFIPDCVGPVCFDTIMLGSVIDFGGPLSGTTPATLSFCLATDTLPAGEYWCEFAVEADSGVLNSPRNISAHLTVTPRVEPSADTIWVSTVPGTPGSKVKVPVMMINQGPICGLQMHLEWGSSKIYLDSVSFEGTRLGGIEKTDAVIDNLDRTVNVSFDAVSFAMPPGEGKIANLYFEVFTDITDGGIVPITLNSRLLCPNCALIADNCTDEFFPQFFPGGIVIDSSANVICGRVVDTAGNEISDAVVEVWDHFPQGTWFAEDTTLFDGSFKFQQLFVVPYTLYAYAEGYYPATLEDINFGSFGLEIVLTPVSPVQPTNEWIDLYCDANTYMGQPLPVGSVVDAFDPDGDHVGSWFVSEAGRYGFMPVYRDDGFTEEDDGADPGDIITLYINGIPAETSSEVIWTQNGDRFEVCLNFDGSSEKSFCLKNGWNLISWNKDTKLDDIDLLFGSIMQYIDVILSFEEVGLTYDPDLPEFSTLTNADHLHGYWVRIENAPDSCLPWTVTGMPVLVNTPIHLEAGWNLVSYLPTVELETPAALVSQEGNLRVALGFDGVARTYEPTLPEFSTLNMMGPCYGYWLKVFEPRTLVYPGFNSLPYIQPEDIDTGQGVLAKLSVEGELTTSAFWMDIYAGALTLDGQTLGAGAEIRVVDHSGNLVGYGFTSAQGKLMFTPVYGAASEQDAGLRRGETFSLIVNGVETNESFTFSDRGARLEVDALTSKEGGTVVLPDEFALEQNYPNPFNPETKITFQLPVASKVELEIFNVLGARIRTLAEGEYPAGASTVTWDGRTDAGEGVASGMYFYRLKAGAFSQTRKMILLK